jgi:hypothetical protein
LQRTRSHACHKRLLDTSGGTARECDASVQRYGDVHSTGGRLQLILLERHVQAERRANFPLQVHDQEGLNFHDPFGRDEPQRLRSHLQTSQTN